MRPYLLIDFGSTYTKLTAVDLAKPAVIGTASALTTVDDGLICGYREALRRLTKEVGPLAFARRLACSSAAGGLRMVAIGLVPELTVEAAKRAALGAGARLVGSFSYELTAADLDELLTLKPDLILLAGGTDGGNKTVLRHNGALLAASPVDAPVILAGNKTVAPEVETTLRQAGKICYRVPNVLPELNRLNIGPVQAKIREVYLERIIYAKGLAEVEREIDGILMPTPAAVQAAAERLATGPGHGRPGWGDLLLVDVGGATTDVHSIAEGRPTKPYVYTHGLPEPKVKRTVEGDLGLRVSAAALLEQYTPELIADLAELPVEEVIARVRARAEAPAYLPESPADQRLEAVLGYLAVKGATERHVGKVEQVYSPQGVCYLQEGKDLTGLQTVIGTGGVFVHSPATRQILAGVLPTPDRPELLKPQAPRFYYDERYLFSTLGLLAKEYPDISFCLLEKALKPVQN
ncbi:methylaspartate mutase accessory protein GlmL [Capillibacterium thermochitinicola]|uniref:Glutamate mutase L n=1 Tax=Capillibacterium thermochitinicola TaxID=2699427 RepID=A0A8J6HZ04_9FIRM|nr:glutamate mutase L [Capillibacterium thermochitinicola]